MQPIVAGDIVEIDDDRWEHVGRQYEVVEITTRVDSTACQMTLRDLANPDRRLKWTAARNQLIRVGQPSADKPAIKLAATVEIKPSLIQNAGVGVFALIDIAADAVIFTPLTPVQHFKYKELNNLSQTQLAHLIKLAHVDQTGIAIDRSADDFHAAYFINHSHNPNVIYCESSYSWLAMRDIPAGQELTAYYFPHERDF
jgi:hypothetical protein